MGNYSKEEIFTKLKEILTQELEINESLINLDANLFEDLELDSIDAVDIAVRMQQYMPRKLTPEEFKSIRTVNDVVETVYGLTK